MSYIKDVFWSVKCAVAPLPLAQSGIYPGCPHCKTVAHPYENAPGVFRYQRVRCGLSDSEHKQVVKAWRQAQEQAAVQARGLFVQARTDVLYPKAAIEATYNEAGRIVRG